ncbi:histidinol phosphatase [Leucobacter sp. OLJS4]|uniref:inositol monophosphatase family protein n=1 Tax=unclassified Leucobacter TaxID=2621730 RepID=UPI000C174916|nr:MULTISPECIES: inositol monophosphatase family protein [unclassified Leucobacter]PIJ54823.1 histidinol phosphatase [Leucobacter sp. OLES1]PII85351.1 histidinol phosphatase [Leucobacter sp. OLCALW19]PII93131.1 histidinol phosphatase [Leucobacter sp. OLAS13]PII96003.1 histidinol phosphatase [Leucobacter sp. OLTLW20]PII99197.1 histidinol phosphatase [Leucobacter sp. OLDS2]
MSQLPPSPSEDLAFALELAELADSISLPRFRAADLTIETKPDRTFVTDADRAVEEALRARIEAERPEDSFFGEESGRAERGERRWILDPIDGTSNFLRGVPNWATLIGLEIAGEVRVGIVSAPAFGTRWWAETGSGAWKAEGEAEPRRLHVSGVSELEHASLSFQSIEQWDLAGYLEPLIALSRAVWRDRAYGDMWSYMLLAEGLVDIVAEFDVKPYDLAALVPIVREAGGRFTDIDGAESAWNGSSLATNGALHDAVRGAIDAAKRG